MRKTNLIYNSGVRNTTKKQLVNKHNMLAQYEELSCNYDGYKHMSSVNQKTSLNTVDCCINLSLVSLSLCLSCCFCPSLFLSLRLCCSLVLFLYSCLSYLSLSILIPGHKTEGIGIHCCSMCFLSAPSFLLYLCLSLFVSISRILS